MHPSFQFKFADTTERGNDLQLKKEFHLVYALQETQISFVPLFQDRDEDFGVRRIFSQKFPVENGLDPSIASPLGLKRKDQQLLIMHLHLSLSQPGNDRPPARHFGLLLESWSR